METKASHLLIGTFVLAMVLASFAFVIWIAKVQIDREFAYYNILFEDGVAGLSVGGDVRYNGIPVGKVTTIILDPTDSRLVRVSIEVGKDTPVTKGTEATLALQGITGVAYVELTGGEPGSPKLTSAKKNELPVIPSHKSTIQKLATDAPELLERIILLVEDMRKIIDKDNRRSIAQILKNTEVLTKEAADVAPDLKSMIENMNRTAEGLRGTLVKLDKLVDGWVEITSETKTTVKVTRESIQGLREDLKKVAGETSEAVVAARQTIDAARVAINNSNQIINTDVRRIAKDARATVKRLENMSKVLEGVMTRNKAAIDVFASEGLVNFTHFVEEARALIVSASRLIETIEADPSRIIFGDQRGGREAK